MQDQISRIPEPGLRRFNAADQYAFEGADDVLEFLAGLPEPEDILKLRPSEFFQARISHLLEKNRAWLLRRLLSKTAEIIPALYVEIKGC